MAETAKHPAKRAKLLSDSSDSSAEEDSGDDAGNLKVNKDFARRFEHNKKREELQRLEEKYPVAASKTRGIRAGQEDGVGGEEGDDDDDEDEDSEDDESEDSEGELATERLDEEISATLKAIKEKDPRVYDQNVRFYSEFDDAGAEGKEGSEMEKKEKPMYLHDYHRRNLLAGHTGEEEEDEVSMTYQQEQDAMKRQLVESMHATANGTTSDHGHDSSDDNDNDDTFLVAKRKPQAQPQLQPKNVSAPPPRLTTTDIESASHDPETYLSNFLASRAWLPSPTHPSQPHPFDSDSSADEARADAFEEAYNLRFEDPAAANETLKSFSRDVGKYSARREVEGGRKRKRERERERKEGVRREREEERARLRRLRREVLEEKVGRIREAGGLVGEEGGMEGWEGLLEGEWEGNKWEEEMGRRFGEGYYAIREDEDEDEDVENGKKKKKLKKPKWDEEIEIDDLVPGFAEEEARATFTLSDEDDDQRENGVTEEGQAPRQSLEDTNDDKNFDEEPHHRNKPTKAHPKRLNKPLTRADLDTLVESSLPLSTHPALPLKSTSASQGQDVPSFRYRSTSPLSFGLTARDILFAEDAQLNAFVGLKKLAAWRDEGKKRKERRRLGKKGRVREWRRDVFGDEEGPSVKIVGEGAGGGVGAGAGGEDGNGEVREGKRKRRKKGKGRNGEERQKEV